MNKNSILSYVKLYKNILAKHQIILSDRDFSNVYQLILLVFELDDLYDTVGTNPRQERLAKIETAMIALMPSECPFGLQAIASVFKAMRDERLLTANSSLNLKRYLRITSQSIGAPIITAYLASRIGIASDVWYSDVLVSFNNEINILIRLANDYLDTDLDLQRSLNEISQVKARDFFQSKFQFKKHLYCRYIVHRLRYYFYLFKFKYLQLSSKSREYLHAIACSESVLDWAFKVYAIDRNSCQ